MFPRCLDQARPIDVGLSPDALAIATRCSTAWGKCRKMLPILTSKHVSPLTRGKVLSACVRLALLHGSETWGPTAPNLQRLH